MPGILHWFKVTIFGCVHPSINLSSDHDSTYSALYDTYRSQFESLMSIENMMTKYQKEWSDLQHQENNIWKTLKDTTDKTIQMTVKKTKGNEDGEDNDEEGDDGSDENKETVQIQQSKRGGMRMGMGKSEGSANENISRLKEIGMGKEEWADVPLNPNDTETKYENKFSSPSSTSSSPLNLSSINDPLPLQEEMSHSLSICESFARFESRFQTFLRDSPHGIKLLFSIQKEVTDSLHLYGPMEEKIQQREKLNYELNYHREKYKILTRKPAKERKEKEEEIIREKEIKYEKRAEEFREFSQEIQEEFIYIIKKQRKVLLNIILQWEKFQREINGFRWSKMPKESPMLVTKGKHVKGIEEKDKYSVVKRESDREKEKERGREREKEKGRRKREDEEREVEAEEREGESEGNIDEKEKERGESTSRERIGGREVGKSTSVPFPFSRTHNNSNNSPSRTHPSAIFSSPPLSRTIQQGHSHPYPHPHPYQLSHGRGISDQQENRGKHEENNENDAIISHPPSSTSSPTPVLSYSLHQEKPKEIAAPTGMGFQKEERDSGRAMGMEFEKGKALYLQKAEEEYDRMKRNEYARSLSFKDKGKEKERRKEDIDYVNENENDNEKIGGGSGTEQSEKEKNFTSLHSEPKDSDPMGILSPDDNEKEMSSSHSPHSDSFVNRVKDTVSTLTH